VKIKHTKAMEIIPPKIKESLEGTEATPKPPTVPTDAGAQIADLERQRKKVQLLAEREIYSPDEAQEKMQAIRAKIHNIQNNQDQHQREVIKQDVFYSSLASLQGLPIAEWIQGDDPETVNPILQRLIKRITISPGYQITVVLKIDGSD
jgi:hypothetical protein